MTRLQSTFCTGLQTLFWTTRILKVAMRAKFRASRAQSLRLNGNPHIEGPSECVHDLPMLAIQALLLLPRNEPTKERTLLAFISSSSIVSRCCYFHVIDWTRGFFDEAVGSANRCKVSPLILIYWCDCRDLKEAGVVNVISIFIQSICHCVCFGC